MDDLKNNPMANMNNAKYENTFNDLRHCFEGLFKDERLTPEETYYRDELIKLCAEITEQEFKLSKSE
ncbi:hypothetical protein [Mucilaginibacter ginsenosidivorax]|uniref:Uncharacterized protein n=1 Tax=Mucilaginibacter ginsenosidivorax TaxID=862126 RepID=A0A5B8W4J3_9SPHI|nr:hypothetical protein [Mucilaginibacter ginsenosidivorax]QEC78764.1 hypothetical protein FSB76_23470 [Mucilaginibacter ginsenosidivorax]